MIFQVAGRSQVIHVSAQRIGMIPNGDDARKNFPPSTTGLKYVLICFFGSFGPGMQPIIIIIMFSNL